MKNFAIFSTNTELYFKITTEQLEAPKKTTQHKSLVHNNHNISQWRDTVRCACTCRCNRFEPPLTGNITLRPQTEPDNFAASALENIVLIILFDFHCRSHCR